MESIASFYPSRGSTRREHSWPHEAEKVTIHPVKIVIRFADGRIDKGYTQDFSPNRPLFHVFKKLPSSESSKIQEIRVSELKAIFFVKSFAGNPNYKEGKSFVEGDVAQGRKAEVVFLDGEILQGSVLGYDPKVSGFFLFPSDPKSRPCGLRIQSIVWARCFRQAISNSNHLRIGALSQHNQMYSLAEQRLRKPNSLLAVKGSRQPC